MLELENVFFNVAHEIIGNVFVYFYPFGMKDKFLLLINPIKIIFVVPPSHSLATN